MNQTYFFLQYSGILCLFFSGKKKSKFAEYIPIGLNNARDQNSKNLSLEKLKKKSGIIFLRRFEKYGQFEKLQFFFQKIIINNVFL